MIVQKHIKPRFEKSEISADISPIFRVSAHLDTKFPSDCRPGEISVFIGFFRRNFGDISDFYRFFPIFPEISVTVHESSLFTTVHNRLLFITVHKMKNLLLRRFEPCPKVQGSNLLSTRLILVLVIYITKL